MPLAGKPVLFHVVHRLERSQELEKIVVATTREKSDDPVEEYCRAQGIAFFRGSENDVLDRYYQAAKKFSADPIIRITADCPIIDPEIVDQVIRRFLKGNYDLFGLSGEFPDGLDCTVFSFKTLEVTWEEAKLPSEREHVCPFMEKNRDRFKQDGYRPFTGLKHLRWTLDEENDYLFLTHIFDRLFNSDQIFLTRDVLELLRNEPHLAEINSGIIRNEGYLKSLEEDKDYSPEQSNSGISTG